MREIRNCNVCVIGGAGFLGSHLVNHLIEDRECSVLVLDNLHSGLLKHVHPQATFKKFDIRHPDLESYLHTYEVDYVFNYAAHPYIPECYTAPASFFSVNADGVLNLLCACADAGVKGILQVSSAEIYGESKGRIAEDAHVIPHSTYGVSKMAADGLVQVRWREAQVPAIALRQFNCLGERETHEYVIPEIISQLHHSAIVRLGNNSVRDFIYAGDAVRMAVDLLEKGQFGEVYNLGSEQAIQIHQLATLIGGVMGKSITIETDAARVRPWEIWYLQSDNSKLYKVIERRPEVDLVEALNRTVQYFHDNGNKWDW